MIKPRQAGRSAPARGRTSAGVMKPKKGKGSYKRQPARLTDERLKRETAWEGSINLQPAQGGPITMRFISTGMGIASTSPRHWLPCAARSVIMPRGRFISFMRGSLHPIPRTRGLLPGSPPGTGVIMPARGAL
jgi:hypothetical protein